MKEQIFYNLIQFVKGLLKNIYSILIVSKKFKIGFITIISIVLVCILVVLTIPYDPSAVGRFKPNQPPSISHILGTDSMGRDVFAQLCLGTLHSFVVALIVATFGTIVGAFLGFISGYYGGILDNYLIRIVIDTFVTIPMLPILILVASLIRAPNIWVLAGSLCIFSWAWPARQVRSQTISLKKRDFIYLAKLSGMNSMEIIIKEIMPHMLQWMVANYVNAVLWTFLTEAGVELLGLGPPTTITLGMMIYWAIFYAAMLRGLWWWLFPPIIMFVIIFISLYLMHIGLEEFFNPAKRLSR
jgi:peptide/nickel transport system permease protein